MAGHGLSKSRIIAWKQCPKRLWLQIHKRDLLEVSDGAERGFQIGYEVGEVAQGLFPDGILIEDDDDLTAALASTQKAMAAHPDRPIFEATFQHDGVLVRADLLLPTPSDYRMVEVKSSASVKPYHLEDCAIQAWVLQQNGIPLVAIELAHIDTAFVYHGDGNYQGLFHHAPLDEVVAPLVELVPGWIAAARCTLAGDEPTIAPGAQCDDPFECPFKAYCNKNTAQPVLPAYSLDVFSRMRATKKDDLRSLGFKDALAVPEEYLNETQQRIQRVSQTGVAELTREAADILSELPYPRYYLDFETINLAVPRWALTSPYSTQVPFQWSCHTEHAPGQLQHAMFLDVSGDDPRRACAETMIATLGTDGPVFVYFQAFEKGRIAELAALFSDLAPALHTINERIVDLLPLARVSYYHPAMRGSWSIKAVLPTIAPELDYTELTVGDGGAAQDAYREILHPATPDLRKQVMTQGLRDYCTLDTLAMVRLAWFLEGMSMRTLLGRLPPHAGSDADALLYSAEAKLREYCKDANSNLVLQPVSLLQRRLKMGYSQALVLIQQLQDRGVLSPLVEAQFLEKSL
ncbi:MAG: DUF2779 domain-containing protein [Rhodoferax sp.]